MSNRNHEIDRLLQKLNELAKKQEQFSEEIKRLRAQIETIEPTERVEEPAIVEISKPEAGPSPPLPPTARQGNSPDFYKPRKRKSISTQKSGLEKFIGENLINKIGIAITVIGVSFGAKYAIENELINPLTRIILAYLFSIGMLIIGMRLKGKYENFSAVLVSGSAALLYIITYIAYDFYDLVPKLAAFSLMVVFTVFTVYTAIHYNRQIIAHVGLVGAYAVPFLLSDGSGNFFLLLTYVAIINFGILAIAFKKNWRQLFFNAFTLSWLIIISWKIFGYDRAEDFWPSLIFIAIFFTTFYITYFAYQIKHRSPLKWHDVVLLLANAFIFYGMGYSILNSHDGGKDFLGFFTVGNALIHAAVGWTLYKKKLIDIPLQQLIAALVLAFVTIAIPVQLEGSWIILLWAAEAALIFWIGRTQNISIFEKLSYPLIALSFIALLIHWEMAYSTYSTTGFKSLLNIHFLTSLIVAGAYGVITYFFFNHRYLPAVSPKSSLYTFLRIAIPTILITAAYFGFRFEIEYFWNTKFSASIITIPDPQYGYDNHIQNYNLLILKNVWIINYSILFTTILALVNIARVKNRIYGLAALALSTIALIAFLTIGLFGLSELRDYILTPLTEVYYVKSTGTLFLRYVSYVFVAVLLYAMHLNVKSQSLKLKLKTIFDSVLHVSILWILSSELINLMEIGQSTQSYKLGLSILWGVYALLMVALGIWKKNQPLRFGAMALFGITLIKLFFYDIAHLNALSKTIVFIALGILLLIISFLYNKYKHLITQNDS